MALVNANLLSVESLVETPFIIVKIGDYTFGSPSYTKQRTTAKTTLNVTFPNYLKSINITKTNGAINQYTINLVYKIYAGADPNLLDKVFGSVSQSRKITISYGDYSCPSTIFKEEEALIISVNTQVDFAASAINYTISAVSTSLYLLSNKYDFAARNAKPSDIIYELLNNPTYGLKDVFKGMTNTNEVRNNGWIASDDQKVSIIGQHSMSILDYMNFLTSNMVSVTNNKDEIIHDSTYRLVIDEGEALTIASKLKFKIVKVGKTSSGNVDYNDSYDTYTIDVGYPGKNLVTAFNVSNDDNWAILFNYNEKINPNNQYIYSIDNKGKIITEYSPGITRNPTLFKTTPTDSNWWTNVVSFPIKASITIKGLVRPSILMSRVRINALFYGQKHISSGLYVITSQQDSISASGYRTVLSLLRISE